MQAGADGRATCIPRLSSSHFRMPVSMQLLPIPEPEAGEARVQMKAAAVNNRDIKMCMGDCEGTEVGTILGSDLAGIVDAVGEGVDESMIGREVIL